MFRAWLRLGEILLFFNQMMSKMGTLSLANDFKTKGKECHFSPAKTAALSQTEGWVRV